MKKYFKPEALPFVTVLLGSLAMLCRVWLMLSGVDEKGLYITGHIVDRLSYILLALTAGGILLCVWPLRGGGKLPGLFPPSLTGALGCLVGGIGILCAGLTETTRRADFVWLLSLLAGCVACVCLTVAAVGRFKGRRTSYVLHCGVTVYFLLHLLSRYRSWSSEPQLQEIFFPLLASVFLLLCAYHRTCLDAGFGSRKWYAFFNQMALFCSMASITSPDWLFYLSMVLWTLTSLCDLSSFGANARMHLPGNVLSCITMLENAGFEAYVVGGCVRDHLMGLEPHDYDLCTSATPEQVAQVFADRQLVRSGEKHGTIGVVIDDNVYEITTFRTEGDYSDGRHPDNVCFVTDLKTDLARRDFTVNAMAFHPRKGYADPFGGQLDLDDRVLRTVGDPETRFREDALRILRGVRFSLRFGLEPEWETENAMIRLAPTLDQLASERVFSELSGILPLLTVRSMQRYEPILTQVIPELKACLGFDQHSRHHAYDVWDHTAHAVEAAGQNLALRFAALLHDLGKPVVFYQDEAGAGHFPDHARVGAEMADAILQRLKAPNAIREQVVFLISHHMTPFAPDRVLLRRRLSQYGEENCRLLLQLQRADSNSKGVQEESQDYDAIEAMLLEILEEKPCLQAKDLAISGHDLIALGFSPGPGLGETISTLLALVVEETLPNEKDVLLEKAKNIMEETQ